MRARRALGAALMAASLAGAVVLWGAAPGPVRADPPEMAGWWNAANAGVANTNPPPPPGVPDEGLYVAGHPGVAPPVTAPPLLGAAPAPPASPEGQEAIAAVRYVVPPGAAVGRLRLAVAGNPVSPTTSLVACPLTFGTFAAGGNQPWSQRPAYDCAAGQVAGTVEPGGQAILFDVAGLARGGVLALAVLPGGGVDRVAFASPGADSLFVTRGGATAPPPAPAPRPTTAPVSGGPVALPPVTDAAGPAPTEAPVPAAGTGGGDQADRRPVQPAAADDRDDARDRLVGALLGLAFVAGLVLVYRGEGGRLPFPVPWLGAGGDGAAALEPPVRGIGRFARPRSGARPRL